MRDESGKVKIFFSYAPQDKKMQGELDKRLDPLKAQGQVTSWDISKAPPGIEVAPLVDEHLKSSHIILLLVSPDFVSEENYRPAEIELAMENHRTGKAIVIPILLRPGVYDGMPFEKLAGLPKNQIPLSSWADRNKAYLDVAKGIQEAIAAMKAKRPPVTLKGDVPRQQIGNYRLIELLGEGGFARVYLGKHIDLDTHAAIKILKTQVADVDKQAFREEARTIAKLEHDHIVHVRDYGLEDNIPYLVMEYAANGTLRQRHPKNSRLPLPAVVSYIRQVADALQYAHDKGLIHRDIKPENLLLGANDKVLLSDFGIAIVAHGTGSLKTELENIVGTAIYMAPEQFKGKPLYASDQYALAVIVYEWLCGKPPFSGDAVQLGFMHSYEPPPKMEFISPAVEQVVLQALAKDPGQRYPDIKDFVVALEETVKAKKETVILPPDQTVKTDTSQKARDIPKDITITQIAISSPKVKNPVTVVNLSESPEVVQNPGNQQRIFIMSRFDKISRRRFLILGGVVGVIALGTVGAYEGIKLASSSNNSPGTATATTRSTPSGTTSTTPSGTSPTSVPVSDTQMCNNTNPFPANSITPLAKTYSVVTYHHHSGEVDTVAWSPDSSRIASGSRDGTVQVWNPDTGNQIHTFKLNFQQVFAVAWSPIGNYLAWGGDDTIVHVQQMGNVNATDYPLAGHTGAIHGLAWSPNGQYIASASDDKTVNIWKWDSTVGGGTLFTTYTGHSDAVHAVAWSPDGKSIASSSVDKTVQVWSASTWTLMRKFIGHTGGVDAVTWSPDSKYLASGSLDYTMRVWDTVAVCQLPAYSGSSGKVLSVAWSPREQLIAAGSDDGQVRVWDPANATIPFYTYPGHTNWVHAVSWAPDSSRRIASASADNTVQIWQP